MSNAWAQAENERIIANLIRIGSVAELDEANARVKVNFGGLKTDWLPWLTARAGATKTWSAPRPGEQVVVLAPYGDPSQGVVLPSIYQDDYAAPATSKDQETTVYPDGSTVDYNSATNTMTVTVSGSGKVIVNCKEATINADTSVTLNAPQTTCTGKLTVEGLLTYLNGMVGSTGSGASAEITGNVNFSGGSLTHNGKNIGSTHTHTGVQPGGGTTGAPS
jgi:phage baseplate assembly protein V